MQRHFFSLRIAPFVILAGIAAGAIEMRWRGAVVVSDPHRLLGGAALDDGRGYPRALRPFARGFWATRPAFEGALRLVCANGVVAERALVIEPGAQTRYTVTRDDCRGAS